MSIHFSFASAVLLFQVARFHGDAFIIQQNLDNSAVHHYERTGTELRRIGEIRKSTCCNALALSTVLGGQEVSDRNNDYSSYPSLFSSITSAYLDSLSSSSDNNDDTASRVKVVGKDEARQTFTYEIRLPQFASSTVSKRHIGMCLREVSKGGRMSGYSFDLDTLLYISADEVRMRPSGSRTSTSRSNTVDGDRLGNVEIQQQIFENGRGYAEVDADLEGVLVSSISRDGEAYNAGVRVGDVLVATSATMGNVRNTNNVEGIHIMAL